MRQFKNNDNNMVEMLSSDYGTIYKIIKYVER